MQEDLREQIIGTLQCSIPVHSGIARDHYRELLQLGEFHWYFMKILREKKPSHTPTP